MFAPLLLLAAAATPAQLSANTNAAATALAPPTSAPSWADEFDGKKVDPAKWQFETDRNKQGWYNDEAQYYGPANATVADGKLTIAARAGAPTPHPGDWGGQRYTSARIASTAAWRYGFMEVRAKLPCTRGTWPAIWMLRPDAAKWPDDGEIDIMEMVGHEPGVVHATLHTAKYNHVKGTQRGAQITLADACTAFHRYQLDWTPDAIRIGVDGRGYLEVRNDAPGDKGAWPFDAKFRLILNVAIGGGWGGAKGIDDAALPQAMDVDYVRVWQRAR